MLTKQKSILIFSCLLNRAFQVLKRNKRFFYRNKGKYAFKFTIFDILLFLLTNISFV